ncbi:hypothetical protein IQ37_09500 [Chryseobacterium piperi]|uniref:Putative beta-lactamase-inhibitor-like PepSY-like domain-containing protein n=1 Tax=Chryseobacterium piperi TaxID=558152 RepID=A0A086BIJ9_9FLAO|nr:PepSY-like domain-containing protein [Chryseobacterium piperi]ASW75585.1 hypothetical protein CJF12_15725 [Chryseobacterium piperi]KFF28763.1 hypothetical protein IQ37_09500 [Chryseobacterium piperi]
MKYSITPINLNDMVNWNLISSRAIRKNIVGYITRHYPCVVVDSIEKTKTAYKINLLNDLKLIFTTNGSFVKSSF